MSNILQYASANKALNDIKQSLVNVGCDICRVESLTDVPKVIDEQLVSGPNAVVNASLVSGPGIKVVPIDRKGYKISADDTALLSQDLSNDLPKGMSIHKALFDIVHKLIPNAINTAVSAPSVLDISFIKVPYDGCDYYPLQDKHGNGRKSGLRPNTWYMRLVLTSQAEPMYVDMGNIIAEIRKEILCEAVHLVDARIDDAINKRIARVKNPDQPSEESVVITPSPTPGLTCGCKPGDSILDKLKDINIDQLESVINNLNGKLSSE
jgi:hypothetical protein|nr:MAG TPA: hypothetical protein [Caudoviricetes sp.]